MLVVDYSIGLCRESATNLSLASERENIVPFSALKNLDNLTLLFTFSSLNKTSFLQHMIFLKKQTSSS